MDKATAEKIQGICVGIRHQHSAIIAIAKESCSDEEYREVRAAVAGFMTEHFMKITENLFRQHPSLVPDELLRDDGSNPYQ